MQDIYFAQNTFVTTELWALNLSEAILHVTTTGYGEHDRVRGYLSHTMTVLVYDAGTCGLH